MQPAYTSSNKEYDFHSKVMYSILSANVKSCELSMLFQRGSKQKGEKLTTFNILFPQ